MKRGLIVVGLILLLGHLLGAHAAIFTVTNSADSGLGTLRWAINMANGTAGRDDIVFQIPPVGSAATIQLLTSLPPISDPVLIDGWSQIGGPSCQPGVELDGSMGTATNGLVLATTNCVVRGLCVNRFQRNGIVLVSGGDHEIYGCFIGTDLTGNFDYGNGRDGIVIDSSSDNNIGLLPSDSCTNRNIISGNDGCGIRMISSLGITPCTRNWIQNNHIGMDITGFLPIPNSEDGVRMESAWVQLNFVGSTATPKPINVISGNGSNGITIAESGQHYIQGNFIGASRGGMAALGNGGRGVLLTNASTCLIGESGGEGRNLISGNMMHGVEIGGSASAGNNVFGNYIGVMSNGMGALPNGGDGVRLSSQCTQNKIGDEGSSLGRNLISGNRGCGVRITGETYGNWIYNNIIGLDAAGIGKIGNEMHGVLIEYDSYGNYVGAAAVSNSGNVISGNGISNIYHGVCVRNGANGNEVARNIIGLNVNNTKEANAGDGIRVELAPANTIGGYVAAAKNVISGNGGSGIQIGPNALGVQVVGNYIGVDTNGLNRRGNGRDGVLVLQSGFNQIGATGAPPNIISANLGSGVVLADPLSKSNVVVNNFIGTDSTGGVGLGNTNDGVHIVGAMENRIGGVGAAGNVIAANGRDGVSIEGGAISNVVVGNLIGVDLGGTVALGNLRHGVCLVDAAGNTIGDPVLGGNTIGGNTFDGVHIQGPTSRGNKLRANRIGMDAIFGAIPLPNGGDGIWIGDGASANEIGTLGVAGRNFVQNNNGAGVRIADGTNNAVRGNAIYNNRLLGIDLGPMGVTPNDAQDPDLGANFLQNAPVLYEATTGSVIVAGLLNSRPSTVYLIQYYRCGPDLDPSGYGEGYELLGFQSVTTGPDGNILFEHTLVGSVTTGEWITATATDPSGNTSEFAQNVMVVANELYGDADGDGMPTRWEGPKHLDPYDPTGTNGPAGDPDGDSVSNWEEYVADTEPSDPSNYFHFVAIAASNETLVTYTSTNTRYYLVYYTEDPTNDLAWTLLYPSAVPGSNGVTTAADPVGPTARVYRADVRLTP